MVRNKRILEIMLNMIMELQEQKKRIRMQVICRESKSYANM